MSYLSEAEAHMRGALAPSQDAKIFCLSLPKTGTTSLQAYLEEGGRTVAGSGPMKLIAAPDAEPDVTAFADACVHRFAVADAFQDQPWCFFAATYGEKFPNAKYIIFTRTFEGWHKSFRYHLGDRPQMSVMLREFMGVPSVDAEESVYRSAYEAHYQRAFDLTRGKPVLTLSIDEADSEEICSKLNAFLGLSIERFPHKLRHDKQIVFQVRQALSGEQGMAQAEEFLERYHAIHGRDDAAARAAKLIKKARAERPS